MKEKKGKRTNMQSIFTEYVDSEITVDMYISKYANHGQSEDDAME